MQVKVYNHLGQEAGEMELPKFFQLPWNADLVHQVVVSQAANLRQPVAHVKNRGEVRGGGKKPWRQKGTGRARHGSIRSPLWKGGGVTHGPTKERSFEKKINKKMANKALALVLSAKIRDGELVVLDHLSLAAPKTKEAAKIFENLSRIKSFGDIAAKKNRVLMLLAKNEENVRRGARNLPFVEIEEARNATALDVINRKYVVLPQAGIDVLNRRLADKREDKR
ncbi:MAG: 50S ribosomal protein L4 [Candidatus Sungbacteria bacterium]|nr:50S ribosomal protein L4 [Candidatus Sungbacteria bacterium]